MNRLMFSEELRKLGLVFEVKNGNEIYVATTIGDIKAQTALFTGKYKLRFVTEFCQQMEDDCYMICVVLRNKVQGYLVVLRYLTDNVLQSISEVVNQADLFEREIVDLFGLTVKEAGDERKLVRHEAWEAGVWPMRKEFPFGNKIEMKNETEEYECKPLFLDGGFQIPVGPVHAGIIEPGHFRFSVIGEEIENLELRLMYKHRGIEKLAENVEAEMLNLVFERVAGESTVAYAELYALLVEKLHGHENPVELKAIRTMLLELERTYNFLDDIAGICVDVGYSYPAKKYSFLSEQIHQLCERLTGSRYMRNSIFPMGSNISFDVKEATWLLPGLSKIEARFEKIVKTTMNSVSFLDRIENTGIVYQEKAKRLGLTGIVGRASGLQYDVRRSYPYELYRELRKEVPIEELGGVFERYKLKIEEIRYAFSYVKKAFEVISNAGGKVEKTHKSFSLTPGSEGMAIVESVKGELLVYGKVGENNRFDRISIKTPSFANWNGLTYAVLGEIVPDFPLCNKSFNMSYSENDR